MTIRTDIDKQLAEMESLLDGVDKPLVKTPKRGRRWMPSWLMIIGVATLVDLGARFFIPSSMPFVLVFEAVIFSCAAVALALPVIRKARLTGFRLKLHKWLAGAFALGAIRSGMWGFGVPVEFANLTIFVLALAGGAALYFRKKKDGSDSVDDF